MKIRREFYFTFLALHALLFGAIYDLPRVALNRKPQVAKCTQSKPKPTGSYVKSQKHGEGTLQWPDGRKYEAPSVRGILS